MTALVFNQQKKDHFIYRIKIEETGEYCKNKNNEPCECSTIGWAEILMHNCKMQYPGKKLILVHEKYNVKR